jgi:anti-anti-sigma factor
MVEQEPAMAESTFPLSWSGNRATVTLPGHIDVSNVGQFRDQLLTAINRGADPLIVDMTATMSCDHACVDALIRANHRATVNGTSVRLVVTAPVIRRMLGIEGLDRLVSIYPTLEAATAAGAAGPGNATATVPAEPANGGAAGPASSAANTPALLWQLLDALGDGLVLCAEDGSIALVNRQAAAMFGYQRNQMLGRSIDELVPAGLRAAHRSFREAYERAPVARPMADRARLVGLRGDGATVPIEVSLTPVPTATGHFVLAVVRDPAQTRRGQDLASLAQAAAASQESRRRRELLDQVVHHLFEVGLSLQAAVDQPGDVAKEKITVALERLDDTIREIRDHSLAAWPEPGGLGPP